VARQPRDEREDLLDLAIATGGPHHVEVLLKPDRHVRVQAED
jgi:hypothetical protein